MESSLILSRVPFRIPLGGGSTDMPSYYEKYGGFVFTVAIDLYMDILIKKPRSDDSIHVHYKTSEVVASVDEVRHEICREALRMTDVQGKVSISFKADTPAGTGLGSSGACAVALLKGLSLYTGYAMDNEYVAQNAFLLTQRLGLPDGKQDPYACALGGAVVLEIGTNGNVRWFHPELSPATIERFFERTVFFYTGVTRDSKEILQAQDAREAFELKHRIKAIGEEIYGSFVRGDLEAFGCLMHEHWNIKKMMGGGVSAPWLEKAYDAAREAGALGGKVLGAGGGGYFMFYCGSDQSSRQVAAAMQEKGYRKMRFALDTKGARATIIDL